MVGSITPGAIWYGSRARLVPGCATVRLYLVTCLTPTVSQAAILTFTPINLDVPQPDVPRGVCQKTVISSLTGCVVPDERMGTRSDDMKCRGRASSASA